MTYVRATRRRHLEVLQWCRARSCACGELTCAKVLPKDTWTRCSFVGLTIVLATNQLVLGLLEEDNLRCYNDVELLVVLGTKVSMSRVPERATSKCFSGAGLMTVAGPQIHMKLLLLKGGISRCCRCRTNCCHLNKIIWPIAAGGGQVEVLQWCKVNGCPWYEGKSFSKARLLVRLAMDTSRCCNGVESKWLSFEQTPMFYTCRARTIRGAATVLS